jgi:hypothetical protein
MPCCQSSKQACRKNAHEQIDREPLLARSFTVTLIVVTSGDGKNLILTGQRFALAAACGSSAWITSLLVSEKEGNLPDGLSAKKRCQL